MAWSKNGRDWRKNKGGQGGAKFATPNLQGPHNPNFNCSAMADAKQAISLNGDKTEPLPRDLVCALNKVDVETVYAWEECAASMLELFFEGEETQVLKHTGATLDVALNWIERLKDGRLKKRELRQLAKKLDVYGQLGRSFKCAILHEDEAPLRLPQTQEDVAIFLKMKDDTQAADWFVSKLGKHYYVIEAAGQDWK